MNRLQTSLAEPASAAPTRVRYQVLLAACAVAVVGYIHRVGFATASTHIKDDLGLSSEDLGYVMTAFLIAYAGFEVPAGALGDRFGVRHLLTVLVLGWSLLTGCVALVVLLPAVWLAQFGFLLVVRFLFGMLQAGCFPCLSRMMTDWMPQRERGRAQGFIWMSSRLGGAIVPLLFAVLFGWFSWEASLWLLALLGVVWSLAFWPWFRNRPEDMPQVNTAEGEQIMSGRAGARSHLSWSELFRSRSVWGLCLMYAGVGFSASFFVTMLPDYLANHRHLSAEQTWVLTSLPLGCGVFACLLGGIVSDWIIRRYHSRTWGRRLNGAIGLIVAGLAVLSTLWVEDPALLAVLLCVTFFCNDMNMGPAWAACADIGERYAGTVGGAMNTFGNLSAAVMTAVAGLLLNRQDVPLEIVGWSVLGRDLLFIIFACCFGLAALSWFLVDSSKPLAVGERAA